MFEAIISFLGLAVAALYVGFLAFKIHAVPLWIIVVATFVLAVRQFVVDLREGAERRGGGAGG